MKKLIAILTIAIVLVGAVFATTNTVKVTTTISPVEPLYRLDATSVNEGTHETDSALAGETGTVDIEGDYLDENASTVVNFVIKQIARSKSFKQYDLTVKASDLRLVKYYDGSNTTKEWSAAHNDDEILPLDTTATIDQDGYYAVGSLQTGTGAQHITLGGNNTATLTALYDGHKVAANDTTGAVQIGTFSCTWKQNEAAQAGEYEAYVVLTVAIH